MGLGFHCIVDKYTDVFQFFANRVTKIGTYIVIFLVHALGLGLVDQQPGWQFRIVFQNKPFPTSWMVDIAFKSVILYPSWKMYVNRQFESKVNVKDIWILIVCSPI